MKKLLTTIILTAIMLFSPIAHAQMPTSFADIIEHLTPSVVNISTINIENSEEGSSALGSGFIVSEDGFIITNNHVIKDAKSVNVILHDNSNYEADIVGIDNKTDIALLKITPAHNLIPTKFGDSDKIRVGDWVLAIGNPFGLGGSVSAGIISAKSRDIESGPYDNFIQTDASINQGSSGGPMFNLNGEVIGINTALFSTNGSSQGVGFAIPVNQANWVVEQLKTKGEVKRGWIGIKIQDNTTDIAKSVELDSTSGAVISGLTEGAIAQKAGLLVGDIILSYNNQNIDTPKTLSRLIAESRPNTSAKITLWREKQNMEFTVLIEEMPIREKEIKKEEVEAPKKKDETFIDDLDLYVREINADTMAKYHLDNDIKGVVVTEVLPTSDAVNKGLVAGDIIVKIDKKDVFTASDVKKHVEEAVFENNRPILLLVESRGIMHFVALKIN